MKLPIRDALGLRAESQSEWHRWFAWYPVVVRIHRKRTRVWLRHIERRLGTSRLTGKRKWRYRLLPR
jgi:hypothetical protein